MLLRLENLQYKRGLNFELRLNLNLATGSRTLLCGANGAGKTSLLNILGGIYPLNSLNGGKLTHALLPGSIALFGHETFFYPELSVRENLLFWLRMEAALLNSSLPNLNNLVEGVLIRLKLMPWADEQAHTLSRGMMQRLALGRIFLSRASLILLDEPENGLDQEFFELLMREMLLKSGATIVWASHNLSPDYCFAGEQVFSHYLYLEQNPNFRGVFEGQLHELSVNCDNSGNFGNLANPNSSANPAALGQLGNFGGEPC